MRLSRLVPALAAGTLLVASTSPAIAQEAPAPAVEGVGTTTGSLTLLGLDAGDLLTLDLLSDAGIANIDESEGARSAAAQISALVLDTAVGEPISVPLFAVESTGEAQEASQEVALPANPVLSGSALPLSLSALVGEDGARSSLSAALADLDVLGGILGLAGAELDLGSTALVSDAAADRGVSVQSLDLLDLESLLAALGIPLTDLPLDTLLGLVDGLGLLDQLQPVLDDLGIDLDTLTVDGLLTTVDGLLGSVGDLDEGLGVLEGLETSLSSATAPVCDLTGGADDLLGDLLGGGGAGTVICDATTSVTQQLATVQASIDDLTAQLEAVLDQVQGLLEAPLDLLSGTSLLSVDGLDISVITKATDDVATSVADVTATLGSLQVGALPGLGSLDLGAGATQIDAVLAQVEGAIGGVLAQIAPSLSDLVTVDTLREQTSVVEEAGQVVATADFTGLAIEVQPVLAELQALLAGVGGTDSLGSTLEGLGLPVPLPSAGAADVLELNGLLAGATGGLPLLGGLAALDEALTLEVASLGQQSVFGAAALPSTPVTPGAPAAPATPAQTPALPRTGSSDTLVLALAMGAVVVALGGRQLLRRSAG